MSVLTPGDIEILSLLETQGPVTTVERELGALVRRLAAEVETLRRVNRRNLCGCEESPGVFGCGLGCPCACHGLRAENARLAARVSELEGVRNYADHGQFCDCRLRLTSRPCSCGYTDLTKRLAAPTATAGETAPCDNGCSAYETCDKCPETAPKGEDDE